LIIKKEELISLIKQNDFLIKEGTKVAIMNSVDSIKQILYNHDQTQEHCIKEIPEMFTKRNQLVFELSRDFSDPTLDYLPFLYNHKVEPFRYEIFLCFINVEEAADLFAKNNKDSA
jgi:hypothetical protein